MYKIQLSIVLFTLLVVEAGAQVTLHGTVRDSITGKPLEFAIVYDETEGAEDVTDSNGEFQLIVSKMPAILSVRLFGYSSVHFIAETESSIDVAMLPQNFILGEIEIGANSSNRFAGNAHRSVWDYCWLGDRILLCEFGNSLAQSQLSLMSQNMDTIAMDQSPERPVRMFNDCMGNAYFMSRDSLYQYFEENGELVHDFAESSALADRVLKHCKGSNNESIFFAVPSGEEWRLGDDPYAFRYKEKNDMMRYFRYDKETEKMVLLSVIEDEEVKRLKQDEVAYDNRTNPRKTNESAFSRAASKHFFYTIMCKEIDAPMYYVSDSIYILDHPHNQIICLDRMGNHIRKQPIEYHLHKDYQRVSLADQAGENLYAVFERNGSITLRRVNLKTGALAGSWRLPELYPEHITIAGGYIYYLTRDEEVREARVLNRVRL